MTEQNVRDALLAVHVPDELEAQRRTWAVVRGAYAEREPAPSRGRPLRLLVAVAVLAALVAAALSPPGRSVGGWIRDRVAGEEDAQPALAGLPSAGRLLVVSEQGPWIVRPDGSKRLLGNYDEASFSPNGLFVVATREHRVVALDPDHTDDVRWTVTRPTPVADARWAPTPGFHVAYREGTTLRVVGGDGEGDRLLAEDVAPVPPAWRPGEGRTVLAYASMDGRVHVVEAGGEELWAADPGAAPEQLLWSDDAGVLLVVTAGRRHPLYSAGGKPAGALETAAGHDVLDAAFAPESRDLAFTAFDPESGQSAIVLAEKQLQRADGRLEDIVFSPNGRWLLTGWPEADQFLFLRLPGVSAIEAASDMRREFDPGGVGATTFPRVAEWCCR